MRFFSGPGPAGLQFLGNLKIEGKTLGVDVVGQRIAVGRRTLAALGMRLGSVLVLGALLSGCGGSDEGEVNDNVPLTPEEASSMIIEWMIC